MITEVKYKTLIIWFSWYQIAVKLLIERQKNTVQSGWTCWSLFTAETTYNENVSIRAGLMSHVFFDYAKHTHARAHRHEHHGVLERGRGKTNEFPMKASVFSMFSFSGLPVVLPNQTEAVLVGAAVLGACASRDYSTIQVEWHTDKPNTHGGWGWKGFSFFTFLLLSRVITVDIYIILLHNNLLLVRS